MTTAGANLAILKGQWSEPNTDHSLPQPSIGEFVESNRQQTHHQNSHPPLLSRRRLLQQASVASGSATWLALGPSLAGAAPSQSKSILPPQPSLQSDPKGILDLLPGMSYQILQKQGDAMSDGFRAPGLPDGMGIFPTPDGRHLVLMRNHEIPLSYEKHSPLIDNKLPTKLLNHRFDPLGFGGVSRLVVDAQTYQVVSSNMVLFGTDRNCAGGHSPWGWLSCEESFTPGHGYVFLCDPEASELQKPRPILSYGRFVHEAATVDPTSMIAYFTEDQYDSCFYRFVPHHRERPFEGRLQALAIKGQPRFKTNLGLMGDQPVAVSWVDLPDATPNQDNLRIQAQGLGAAIFVRGEGIWFHHQTKSVYFACTEGGASGKGQVFTYHQDRNAKDPGYLSLAASSPDESTLNMPDNIVVTSRGDIIVAEDPHGIPHIRIIKKDGTIHTLARNALPSQSEFTGVCLSPREDTLFVNIQKDGLTLAVNLGQLVVAEGPNRPKKGS